MPIKKIDDDFYLERLSSPVAVKAFLTESLTVDDPRVFLRALFLTIKASDRNMGDVAKAAGIERETLYRALGESGNPTWSTVTALLKEMGFVLTIKKRRRIKSV